MWLRGMGKLELVEMETGQIELLVHSPSSLIKFNSWPASSKGSTQYLNDTNRFDISSKGPSSGSVTLIPNEGHLLETSNLFVLFR